MSKVIISGNESLIDVIETLESHIHWLEQETRSLTDRTKIIFKGMEIEQAQKALKAAVVARKLRGQAIIDAELL